MKSIIFAVILLEMAALPLLGADSEFQTVEEIEIQIQKVKEQMGEEEKSWAEEKTAEAEKDKNRTLSYDNFKKEKQEIEASISRLENEVSVEIAAFEALKQKEAEYQARFKRFSDEVLAKVEELKVLIGGSIPYEQNKRLESLQILLEDIASGNISMEEAFNRLYVNYENENRLAEEAEVYSGDFTDPNGSVFQVNYLRIGKVIQAFSSPDGTRLGLMVRRGTDDPAWLREDEMDVATRTHIRKAISTADDKAVPAFVPVPVMTESFKTEQPENSGAGIH